MFQYSQKIFNLIENDPNSEVLLGGLWRQSTFYDSYTFHLLEHGLIDDVMELFNIYVPYTYSPCIEVFFDIFKKIEQNRAAQYIPKVWFDMEITQFSNARDLKKIEAMKALAEVIMRIVDKDDENLSQAVVKIGMYGVRNLEMTIRFSL